MDVIFETKKDVDFNSEILKIGKTHYTKCYINREKKLLVVQPIKKPLFKISREKDKEITCPNCGYEQMDSWEQDYFGEHKCSGCGSKYSHERERYPLDMFSTKIISANRSINTLK